ncbi:hypothetical protein [Sphingomonas sp. Leaf20]|uniref:hypothetical protein n=1 Tax=Sphingomonas sp. Leaf20 TaxID=1735685 RepID=UPI000AE91D49|nr:hypothetical protein [Sphingomonas sp. Leaf20]
MFPGELIDALLAGNVVFLCGTGISAPQLPGFRKLVDDVSIALAVPPDASEQGA